MSLIFRSVKKISKKKRKTSNRSKTKKCCKDPFEDNPTKFVVEDDENRSEFPTLNSVYKTDLFGTPLPFRSGNGYDCMKFLKIKTKLQSIAFMNEYSNKSFEELRWEDYQCNRKGSHIFEERNYLKCLSKDVDIIKWNKTKKFKSEPVTKALTKQNSLDIDMVMVEKDIVQPQKIILQRPNKDCFMENKTSTGKSFKERSILTNVNKLCPIKEAEFVKPPEAEQVGSNIARTNSDINLSVKREEMVRDNIRRYFSTSHSNSSVPYEFYTQNNNYFLPCTNINLAYNNKQTNISSKNQSRCTSIWDLLKSSTFGYDSIFDKLDPVVEKGSLYEKLFGLSQHNLKKEKQVLKPVVAKYTPENRFNKDYFWGCFSPYPRDGRRASKSFETVGVEKFTKAKNHWLGLHVVS